jgi:hypothetical protein
LEITASQLIQLLGITASVLIAVNQFVTLVRDWRGGSPELRLIKTELKGSNDKIYGLLERLIDQLEKDR